MFKMFKYLFFIALVVVIIFPVAIFSMPGSFHVIEEHQKGVLFRLGKLVKVKQPGPSYTIPKLEQLMIVDMRLDTEDVPAQDVITKDNITIKVDAVINYRITDPSKVVIKLNDYKESITKLAQTTLRSACGQVELDELLSSRNSINEKIQIELNDIANTWGIEVPIIQIKHINLPPELEKTIATQAIAEREKRSKIIYGESERELAKSLVEAANTLSKNPNAMQLKYLQTLSNIGSDGKIILLPLPQDILELSSKTLKEEKSD